MEHFFQKNNPKVMTSTFPVQVEKLQVRLDKAYTEKDKLEAKLENSQSELGKSKAELDKMHGDSRYETRSQFSSGKISKKNLNFPIFQLPLQRLQRLEAEVQQGRAGDRQAEASVLPFELVPKKPFHLFPP